MYVKKMTLINVRSYPKLEMEFSRGINLFVGNNNSGKSSIIKALYKLQNQHSINEEDIRKSAEYARIFIDLNEVSSQEAFLFSINDKENQNVPGSSEVKVIHGMYTDLFNRHKKMESYYLDPSVFHSFDNTGKIEFPDNVTHPVLFPFSGLPNLETQNNFIYPFFSRRKTNYYTRSTGGKDAFFVGEDMSNLTSKVQKISNLSHIQHEDFVRAVRDILGFNIGVIPYKENEMNTGIFVTRNKVIPLESMGEGVANILGLIVILLTEDNKLFLIEELENDIHPQALKKLLNLIQKKSENNQFVISTHSNLVVKYLAVNEAKIFHTTWKPNETENDRLPTSAVTEVKNDPASKLALLESLGYELFDFDLYSSYLIFEESSAEKIVRDFLIPEFAPTLINKIKTNAASGASDIENRFHSFLSLFVFVHQTPIYHRRAWIFADGDDEGLKATQSLKEKFASWPEDHFINFSKKNFEEYYPPIFAEDVAVISSTKGKQKKRELKIELTNKVFSWCMSNKELAREEFQSSAKEVTDHLLNIEKKLTQKTT